MACGMLYVGFIICLYFLLTGCCQAVKVDDRTADMENTLRSLLMSLRHNQVEEDNSEEKTQELKDKPQKLLPSVDNSRVHHVHEDEDTADNMEVDLLGLLEPREDRLQALLRSLRQRQDGQLQTEDLEYDQSREELDVIPLQTYKLMSNLTLAEVLQKYVKNGNDALPHDQRGVQNNLAVTIPACKPRPYLLMLPRPLHPMAFNFPWCVKINRCGGCCDGSKRMSCQPTNSNQLRINVAQLRMKEPTSVDYTMDSYQTRIFTEHTQCECKCSVTSEMCSRKQRFDPGQCACVCKDSNPRQRRCSHGKLWNHSECECQCREQPVCQEDELYDERSCRCEVQAVSRELSASFIP